ncbi:GyrB-like ATPase domain protein [Nile crocodilepox virus]|uniref:DNA topoisomerase (ATP-hydrolyzing) n=1 Tax=Nile crocodilepox virus (isolate Crocodylus niloticus/Zimbabwe/Ume/2001) TaxID=1289473 RepID=Q070G1_CPRVZ|nr:GyrB-like ATPase domain protein [Nile crocodilepox virus]ABJ08981.1 GyrB-like ATPase domain protein [Nile crocodilepox virus]
MESGAFSRSADPDIEYRSMRDEAHVLANPSEYLGVTCTVTRGTIFNKRIRYHAGAAKLCDEAVSNAIDHCLITGSDAVNVDMRGVSICVANRSRVPVRGALDGEPGHVIPRALLRQMRTSGNYVTRRSVSGRHGHGLKLIHLFAERLELDVSDGDLAYSYRREGGDVEESVLDSPLRDERLGTRFFRLRFSPDPARLNAEREELAEGLREYVVSRLCEYVFYLAELGRGIAIHFNGDRLPYVAPWFLRSRHVTKRFSVTYVPDGRTRFDGLGVAYVSRERNSKGALVNGARVKKLQLMRVVADAIAETRPDLRRCHVSIFLLVECAGITFTSQEKVAVDGRFEIPGRLFSAADLDPLSRPPSPQSATAAAAETVEADVAAARALGSPARVREKGSRERAGAGGSDGDEEEEDDDARDGDATAPVSGEAAATTAERAGERFELLVIREPKNVPLLSAAGRRVYAVTGDLPDSTVDRAAARENADLRAIARVMGVDLAGRNQHSTLCHSIVVFTHDAPLLLGLLKAVEAFWPTMLARVCVAELPKLRCCKRYLYADDEPESHADHEGAIAIVGPGTLTDQTLTEILMYRKPLRYAPQTVRDPWGACAREEEDEDETAADAADPSEFDLAAYLRREREGLLAERSPDLLAGDVASVSALKRAVLERARRRIRVDALAAATGSREEAVVRLGATFVGGLNFPFVVPTGNFGSRRRLGADASPGSQLYCRAMSAMRVVYRRETPCVPMLLVNGFVYSDGSVLPSYHIADVVEWLEERLAGRPDPEPPQPHYRDFEGDVTLDDDEIAFVGRYGPDEALGGDSTVISEISPLISTEAFSRFLAGAGVAARDECERDVVRFVVAGHPDLDATVTDRRSLRFAARVGGEEVEFGSVESLLERFFEETLRVYSERCFRAFRREGRARVRRLELEALALRRAESGASSEAVIENLSSIVESHPPEPSAATRDATAAAREIFASAVGGNGAQKKLEEVRALQAELDAVQDGIDLWRRDLTDLRRAIRYE